MRSWALGISRFRTGPKQQEVHRVSNQFQVEEIIVIVQVSVKYVMSRNSYGTFSDSLNSDKTELRSIGEATGADEVTKYSNEIHTLMLKLLKLIVKLLFVVPILLYIFSISLFRFMISHKYKLISL